MSVCVVRVCHLRARCFTPCENLSGCGARIFPLLTLGGLVSQLFLRLCCSTVRWAVLILAVPRGPSAGCVLFIFVNLHLSVLFKRQMFVLLSGCDVIEELIILGGKKTSDFLPKKSSNWSSETFTTNFHQTSTGHVKLTEEFPLSIWHKNDHKHICLNVLRNIPSLLACVIMDGDCPSFADF